MMHDDRDESPFPSPLAGEGASRRRREAGEGAPPPSSARSRARALRSQMTDAEQKLWRALRDRRLRGIKIRRQVPIGPYIADFICYEKRLVIEVDGGQHADSPRDLRRDQWLATNGFRILRFWNNEVLSNLDGVLTVVVEALREAAHPAGAPRRQPSSARGPARGEREEPADGIP